jgi:hypothetical protein
MKVNIKTTKNIAHDAGIKCVLYGFSGVGKTVLCSTAPNPIILSAEGGLLSLSGLDVPYIEVSSIKDIGDAYTILKDNNDYETICIDSLSEIAEVVLDELKKEAKDGRQAYMHLANAVNAMIRNFRDLKGQNVVFVAKAKKETDEESGVTTIEPYAPGQVIKFQLPYMVDEVLYMDVDRKGNRIVNTQATRKFVAKDRSGQLSEKEAPNLTEIFKKISGV